MNPKYSKQGRFNRDKRWYGFYRFYRQIGGYSILTSKKKATKHWKQQNNYRIRKRYYNRKNFW